MIDATTNLPPQFFTIGEVVARLQPDFPSISHSSLRFLEREGLLAPHRTGGRHRLFTQGDLDRVRQIKQWQQQRLTLSEIHNRLASELPPVSDEVLASRFLRQALDGEGVQASRLLLERDDAGLPLQRLLQDILEPALHDLGQLWLRGEISVAQEKEVSELTRSLLAELTHRHLPGTINGKSVVAASVAGELHDIGLRMIVALFVAQGWSTHFLGADAAPQVIADAVQGRKPDLLLLSVTLASHLPAVQQTIEMVRATSREAPRICVGGAAVIGNESVLITWGAEPMQTTSSPEFTTI